MNSMPLGSIPRPRFRLAAVVVAGVLVTASLAVVGITGYFRLSSDTAVLRDCLIQSVPGTWEKRVVVRVGPVTTGLVRFASRFFALEAEPRAAVNTLHGADVGVYRLRGSPGPVNGGRIVGQLDRAMRRHGWDRAVGVFREDQLVAIYVPRARLSPERVKCCVLVYRGGDLVVGSARGNLEPLAAIAAGHFDSAKEVQKWARR
jgi:hypothetical protein